MSAVQNKFFDNLNRGNLGFVSATEAWGELTFDESYDSVCCRDVAMLRLYVEIAATHTSF